MRDDAILVVGQRYRVKYGCEDVKPLPGTKGGTCAFPGSMKKYEGTIITITERQDPPRYYQAAADVGFYWHPRWLEPYIAEKLDLI
jgi:hypothetical protein